MKYPSLRDAIFGTLPATRTDLIAKVYDIGFIKSHITQEFAWLNKQGYIIKEKDGLYYKSAR